MSANRTVILVPMFNDWEAAGLLLQDLDKALAGRAMHPEVLLIDDGSSERMPENFAGQRFDTLQRVSILRLRRNLGHQRAIAVGLVYIFQNTPCEAVVVMDADGEDRPEDIPRLAEKFKQEGGRSVIFAARSKRLEGLLFRALYHVYRWIHRLITGDPVRVGNFSMIPFATLSKLVVVPEIWQHYAAAVIRSRVGHCSIPIARARRRAGKSKMNFIGLLLHGLSAFFVYGDIVGARLLVAIALGLMAEVLLAAIGFGTHVRVSLGAVAYVALILGIILLQAIPTALILVFTVIGSRAITGFLPVRDCPYFVDRVENLYPHGVLI